LTSLDTQILRVSNLPSIYSSGVRYRGEPSDVWRHVADVMKTGHGDCEDLAAARAAELRVSGVDPGAFVHVYRSGARRYHAVVGRSDGTIEDPSWILGMKTPRNWQPIRRVGETRF
jgi:transglutaminase-like putative cysteine protease